MQEEFRSKWFKEEFAQTDPKKKGRKSREAGQMFVRHYTREVMRASSLSICVILQLEASRSVLGRDSSVDI